MTVPASTASPDRRAATPTRGAGPLARELRTVCGLVHRDLLRLVRQPVQAGLMLVQPLMFLLSLGGGLGALIPDTATGGDYRTFLFPGILVTALQTSSIGVGVRLIADRDSGYLRETLMSPARRGTVLTGLCLGGTAVATAQGTVLLAFVGTSALPYAPTLLAGLFALMLLTAFTLAALSCLPAVVIRSLDNFHILLSLAMLPLVFLSGAFFPLSALPGWLHPLAALNPVAYSVDLMHHCVQHHAPTITPAVLDWGGWTPPGALEVVTLLVLDVLVLGFAARRLARPG
ncbi:ABC transporter permease [Streptomyces sp. NPDC003077]|uniref:ABC transporter permease n=1 Tax=Streptomyces sp. NPDC003077 TaxID=3154443 RepID=UPI0033AFE42B